MDQEAASGLKFLHLIFTGAPTGADQAFNEAQFEHRLYNATTLSAAYGSDLESDKRLADLFEGPFMAASEDEEVEC